MSLVLVEIRTLASCGIIDKAGRLLWQGTHVLMMALWPGPAGTVLDMLLRNSAPGGRHAATAENYCV